MKFDFLTIGGATEDITFYTKEGVLIDNKQDILRQKLLAFEYGAKIKIDKSYSTFGGGAANAAVCQSLLKLNVATIVAVGDDERGTRILNNLKKNRINTDFVQIIKQSQSGFSFLLVGPGNEHIVFSDRASNKNLSISKNEIKLLDSSKWIYITSLSGKWREVLDSIFMTKTKIAWNPGHIQLDSGIKVLGKYFKKVEALILNKDEAIELVVSDNCFRDKDNRFLNNMRNLLVAIKKWGPNIVVITNGKNGADAYDGQKFYHQNVIKENKRIDTTGVGDAFGSTFIAGLEIFKNDIKKAMELGAKNTASVIGQQGAQNGLLSKKKIMAK